MFDCGMPSMPWHCWLGVRKSIRPVKIEWWEREVYFPRYNNTAVKIDSNKTQSAGLPERRKAHLSWPQKWGAGLVVCLERGANDLHNFWSSYVCHCPPPSSLASLKSRLVFSFLLPAYPSCPGKKAVKRRSIVRAWCNKAAMQLCMCL